MFVFDIIGTIAFAMAGALTAIQKKLDIFGVFMLFDDVVLSDVYVECWVYILFIGLV